MRKCVSNLKFNFWDILKFLHSKVKMEENELTNEGVGKPCKPKGSNPSPVIGHETFLISI